MTEHRHKTQIGLVDNWRHMYNVGHLERYKYSGTGIKNILTSAVINKSIALWYNNAVQDAHTGAKSDSQQHINIKLAKLSKIVDELNTRSIRYKQAISELAGTFSEEESSDNADYGDKTKLHIIEPADNLDMNVQFKILDVLRETRTMVSIRKVLLNETLHLDNMLKKNIGMYMHITLEHYYDISSTVSEHSEYMNRRSTTIHTLDDKHIKCARIKFADDNNIENVHVHLLTIEDVMCAITTALVESQIAIRSLKTPTTIWLNKHLNNHMTTEQIQDKNIKHIERDAGRLDAVFYSVFSSGNARKENKIHKILANMPADLNNMMTDIENMLLDSDNYYSNVVQHIYEVSGFNHDHAHATMLEKHGNRIINKRRFAHDYAEMVTLMLSMMYNDDTLNGIEKTNNNIDKGMSRVQYHTENHHKYKEIMLIMNEFTNL